MPKVTVLVAVYNAASYLRTCLDSLQRQTMRDFQAVCIDDCSADGSLDILIDYSRRDPRFEIIGLDANHGQAYARNQGLKQARGEYVCMLDADDWFSPDALQQAVDVFERYDDTDSVLFDCMIEHASHTEHYDMPEFESLTGLEAFRMSLTWQIHGLYMVRRAIHWQYPYDDTCRLYSDDNTTRLHFMSSRRVRRCAGIYHYLQHEQSSTHVVSVRRFDYLRANESMRATLLRLHVDRDILALYENHRWLNFVGVYMFYFVHGRELSAEDRKYGLRELYRVWHNVDRSLLNKENNRKFGYSPMPTWSLFRLQEWLYFTLRGFLGKNY